jgi:hypothetical protein
MDLKYNINERLKICNLQLPMQSVPNTTEVVSLNSANGKVYSLQHCVINFVSDLWEICGFLQFPPPVKLTAKT